MCRCLLLGVHGLTTMMFSLHCSLLGIQCGVLGKLFYMPTLLLSMHGLLACFKQLADHIRQSYFDELHLTCKGLSC